ncbi:MAG: serine/threonine protein kinase [Candidatus Angelobacter sp.]|jgi:serine/threonine protein kinase|nr:serine/threonine protein kinase [Candidatus Angelobacter sp.]
MGDQPAKKIGDYEILGILGAGGMGRVYKVRNSITDRVEAMKVLLPDLQGHEEVAARFLREIKVLAALNHPNIAKLLTALTIDNQLVMIMEYVEGQSLSSRLNNGPIPVPDALSYLDQVLEALSYAHHQHVIHRDIKPANMMLTPAGNVKLMDFGIARTEDEPSKLTAPGSTLGSMSYMSPEQVTGAATDERSDLYSLGISLYEMVTGEKPFQGESNFSIMAAHINQAPTPPMDLLPGLPNKVNEIILTSIAKSPAQRFQSADAFRYAVKQVLQSTQDEKTFVQGSQDSSPLGAAATPAYVRSTAAAATARNKIPVTPPTAPAVTQPMPIPPTQSGNNRGLYMGFGALVLVAVLIAAGIYIPGHKKASAAEESGRQETISQPSQPSLPEKAEPKAAVPVPSEVKPAEAPIKKLETKSANSTPAVATANNNSEIAAAKAELDAIEHEIDQLTGRAAAVNSGLENLQRQQAASGFGLRGDMASKQASMNLNLSKAGNAIQHNDVARAKKYAEMTSADVEALEKFLGR